MSIAEHRAVLRWTLEPPLTRTRLTQTKKEEHPRKNGHQYDHGNEHLHQGEAADFHGMVTTGVWSVTSTERTKHMDVASMHHETRASVSAGESAIRLSYG